MCTYSKSNESLLICIMVKSCGRYKTMISLETHTQRIFFLSEEYWTNTFCFSWIFCVYWFNLGFLWSPPLLLEVTQWYALCFLVNKLTSKCMHFYMDMSKLRWVNNHKTSKMVSVRMAWSCQFLTFGEYILFKFKFHFFSNSIFYIFQSMSLNNEEEGWIKECGDAPDARNRLTSYSGKGRGSWVLPQSSWRVHRCCGRFAFRDRHFNSRQPSGLNKLNLNFSTLGWVILEWYLWDQERVPHSTTYKWDSTSLVGIFVAFSIIEAFHGFEVV